MVDRKTLLDVDNRLLITSDYTEQWSSNPYMQATTRTWGGRETSRGMFLARFPVGSCQNPGSPPSIVLPADGGLQSPCLDSVEVRLDRVASLTFTSDEIGFCLKHGHAP